MVPPTNPLGIEAPAAGTPMTISGAVESTRTVIAELARDTPEVVDWATSRVHTPSASAIAVLYEPEPETAVVNVDAGIAPTTEPL
ncbi:unannotated protein [freshwater metagenome]|uniref:Unannotated protein n=1 Tax=freshwater metagenome TaxID=449393 RepID=A0A6J5YB37_9ZZZZ